MERPTILIVDDNPQNLQLIAKTLHEQLECDPILSTNGVSAVEVAKERIPSLILLDIMMPDISGLKVCQLLRSCEKTQHIPIIFVTALSEQQDLEDGFAAGGNDYITKPIRQGELIARLKLHLEREQQRRMLVSALQSQRTFQRILCHDLLNPVCAVHSFLELSSEATEPMKTQFMDEALRSVKNTIEIIHHVRELAQLEENPSHLEISKVQLLEQVNRAIINVSTLFNKKKIIPVVDVPQELSVCVEPISFVYSVLSNLLTNAAKFSRYNSPLEISAHVDENRNACILNVQDFGVGISEQALSELNRKGKLISSAGTEGETGTGYGLPLVLEYMKAFGGEVLIESNDQPEVGQTGTTFSLILPLC